MLQPSSSEESDGDDVVASPPAAITVPAAAPLRPRPVVVEDEPSSSPAPAAGPQCSPGASGNTDQRSLSTVSRGSGDNVSLSGTASGGSSSHMLYSSGGVVARPSSPSPSTYSSVDGRKTDLERTEREEEERRRRMQLYVLVMRCVAYPFNAKQPTDMVRRHAKVTKQQLQAIRERFQVTDCVDLFNNNNKQICIASYGRNFRGAGARQRVSEQRKKRKPATATDKI